MPEYISLHPAASLTGAWQVAKALASDGWLPDEGSIEFAGALVAIQHALVRSPAIAFDEAANDRLYQNGGE